MARQLPFCVRVGPRRSGLEPDFSDAIVRPCTGHPGPARAVGRDLRERYSGTPRLLYLVENLNRHGRHSTFPVGPPGGGGPRTARSEPPGGEDRSLNVSWPGRWRNLEPP